MLCGSGIKKNFCAVLRGDLASSPASLAFYRLEVLCGRGVRGLKFVVLPGDFGMAFGGGGLYDLRYDFQRKSSGAGSLPHGVWRLGDGLRGGF